MANGILLFLLFALPFVVIPFGISPFETYKVIAAEIFIEILLILKIFYPRYFKKEFNKRQLIFTGLLVVLAIFDFIIFQNSNSFFGNPFRLQGLLLLLHLLLFFLIAPLIDFKAPRFLYITFLLLLFISTILFGTNSNSRFFGILGEPNALAATTIFLFPFIYFYNKISLKLAGFLLVLAILFLSGSRSGLIAFFIQIFFILASQTNKISVSKTFLMCLGLVGLSLLLPFFEQYDGLYQNRLAVWQTAFYAGLQSPIVGWGFGNIESAIHNAALMLNNPVRVEFVDSSHNFILDFFVQGGIIGLSLFFAILFLSIKNLVSRSKKMELAILLGLMTAMSFNPVSVVNLVGFWWVLGQGFSQNKK